MRKHKNLRYKPQRWVYIAPWERSFEKFIGPIEEFIHRQTTSGLLLMSSAIIALILANSPLAENYLHILHTPISVGVANWAVEMSLHHWINDVLWLYFSL
jgi:NhaA family Na+:H+ antiporter